MSYRFFLSYRRADDGRDARIREFFDSLEEAIRRKTGAHDAGFMDSSDLKQGEAWKPALVEGLCRSRTFVPILSAPYFDSENCGREWGVFERRLRDAYPIDESPPLILPVLWHPPVGRRLPDFALDLQFTISREDFPGDFTEFERRQIDEFHKRGLYHVISRRQSSHGNTYETIVDCLATRIIVASDQHPLPDLPAAEVGDYSKLENHFAQPAKPLPAAPVEPTVAEQAAFVFVAAHSDEITDVRPNDTGLYGPDRTNWRPFAPDDLTKIAVVAQRQASPRNLVCEWVPPDGNLIDRLRQAEQDNGLAIVMIDPWSLRIQAYQTILQKFDEVLFGNCMVLVVWNLDDPHTRDERDKLAREVRDTISRHVRFSSELVREDVAGADQLDREVHSALELLEGVLASDREPVRPTGAGRFERLPTPGGGAAEP